MAPYLVGSFMKERAFQVATQPEKHNGVPPKCYFRNIISVAFCSALLSRIKCTATPAVPTSSPYSYHEPPFPVPALTKKLQATLPEMTAADTDTAIQAAHTAFQTYKKTPARQRARWLRKWADLCLEHADDLALILTLENGKPLTEAKGEVTYAASFLEWFAGEAERTHGECVPPAKPNQRIITFKQPVGVEFPHRDDQSESGRGAGGRLYDCVEAGGGDAVECACASSVGGGGRVSEGVC
jgi:hypothetical protein